MTNHTKKAVLAIKNLKERELYINLLSEKEARKVKQSLKPGKTGFGHKYKIHDLNAPLLTDYPIIEANNAKQAICKYLEIMGDPTLPGRLESSSDRPVPFLVKRIDGKRWIGYRYKPKKTTVT